MSKTLVKSADLAYYSFDKVMSYNGVYNFIIGARGLGKSYGMKEYVIRQAINSYKKSRGAEVREFIYLRRYKPELRAYSSFFADIWHLFPEWDFRVNGDLAQMSLASDRELENDKKGPKRKWITIGYSMALSTHGHQKSRAFPLVTTIIYDEFIIEKGNIHYMTNEAKIFNDLYLTVDRWKDKTRVFFLANALSIVNPYFMEYDILPENGQPEELIVKGGGFLVAHFPDSASFAGGTVVTRFGQFIQGTAYEEFAVGNRFADNSPTMIKCKTSAAQYNMSIETIKGTFSIWNDYSVNEYYVQEKQPKNMTLRVLDPARMREGVRLMERNDKRLQRYRAAFNNGAVFFDNPRTRNAFIELFRR